MNNSEIKQVRDGLKACISILEREKVQCQALSRQIEAWLDQGRTIRTDIESVAGVISEKLDMWSAISEGLDKKLERDREQVDPADYWKNT